MAFGHEDSTITGYGQARGGHDVWMLGKQFDRAGVTQPCAELIDQRPCRAQTRRDPKDSSLVVARERGQQRSVQCVNNRDTRAARLHAREGAAHPGSGGDGRKNTAQMHDLSTPTPKRTGPNGPALTIDCIDSRPR